MIDAKTLQNFLKTNGYYTGAVDGIFGPASYAAARAALKMVGTSVWWNNARTYVAISQLFLNKTIGSSLVIDGMSGPKTNDAIYVYTTTLLRTAPVPNSWPRQRDAESYYGEVGKNQLKAKCPYTLFGDYNRTIRVNEFSCHKLVKPSVERVLRRTLDHYGPADIRRYNLDIFSGCFVVRRVTSGVGYSMHSWGIAIDFDANNNQFHQTSSRAAFAKPHYKAFLDFWEDEGWTSLGRARNYDWMHVQAARL